MAESYGAVCMVFDDLTGNAIDSFDYTADELERRALEVRRELGEVTTITVGPSPFIQHFQTWNAAR